MANQNDDTSWIDCFLGLATIAALVFFYYGTVMLAVGAKS